MTRRPLLRSRVALVGSLAAVASLVALALPVTSVGASPHLDATNYHATCTKLTGTVRFSPPLKTSGTTTGSETYTISSSTTHCKVTGTGTKIVVHKMVASGTLSSNDGTDCLGLLEGTPPTGTLSFRWHTNQKLIPPTTTLSVKSIDGNENKGRAHLIIPGSIPSTATGPFSGSGGSSDTVNVTGSTIAKLTHACSTKAGLRSIKISGGLLRFS